MKEQGNLQATLPDKDEGVLPAPVTPPSGKEDKLNELYKQFVAEADKIRSEEDTTKYPKSPGLPGTITTFGSLPLANLGIAPGATVHSGYAVQYGKPREADTVKLLPFPKPGTSFEKWWDHALDSISSATSYCTEAYRWALEVQKSETTFEKLSESGGFVRLDALLLTALMECIPGDTHLLRQEIKKAKTLQRQTQERNITGRQVLFMVFHFFAMNQKDKSMTDTARLHKISLQNGDIQTFLYKWDEMLSLMTKRPEDDDLMNLFVLQFDLHLPKNHEFYVEYLFWYNRPAEDVTRTYEGLWRLVHDWVRRKKDTKNRREALKDHLPGIARPEKGKGKGKGKSGETQVCFAWRDKGVCAKLESGECKYAHPQSAKGKGKTDSKGKGKGCKQRSPSSSRGGKSGGRSASPSSRTVTDPKLLCQNYLKGKCDKGKSCKYHHNGVCTFHKKGICNKGDKCVFTHHDPPTPALAATTETNVPPSPKSAAAKQKALAKAKKDENA